MNESDGGDDDATVAFRLTDMTSTNTLFRRVVYTGVYQLVLMSLNEEETLEDMQPSVDQMISVTSGTISVKLGGKHVYQLVPGSCLNIKMGVYFSAEATSIRMDTSNLSAARATFWILYSAPIFPQQLIQDNNLDLGTFSPSTTPKQGHVPPRLSGSKIPCLIILQSDLSFPGVERELGRVIPMGNFKQSFTSGEEQPNLTLYLVALTTRLETTSITRTELAAAKSRTIGSYSIDTYLTHTCR